MGTCDWVNEKIVKLPNVLLLKLECTRPAATTSIYTVLGFPKNPIMALESQFFYAFSIFTLYKRRR